MNIELGALYCSLTSSCVRQGGNRSDWMLSDKRHPTPSASLVPAFHAWCPHTDPQYCVHHRGPQCMGLRQIGVCLPAMDGESHLNVTATPRTKVKPESVAIRWGKVQKEPTVH